MCPPGWGPQDIWDPHPDPSPSSALPSAWVFPDVSHLLLFVSLLYFVAESHNGRGLVPSIWHTKCHPCALLCIN